MSSLFIVLSGYFLNIICSTNFPVVPLTYFGSFPILIRVFCCIYIFIILFSNFFYFFFDFFLIYYMLFLQPSIFLSLIFPFFLDSMLFRFHNSLFHKIFPIFV